MSSSVLLVAPPVPPMLTGREQRAVSRRQRALLYVLFALAGLLTVTGLYLFTISMTELALAQTQQSYFYFLMYLAHVLLGLLSAPAVVIFGLRHFRTARTRTNAVAKRRGLFLFAIAALLTLSGLLLVQVELGGVVLRIGRPAGRDLLYWLHVLSVPGVLALFFFHRRAGRPMQWHIGGGVLGILAAMAGVAALLHVQDPRRWRSVAPAAGRAYFAPSLARTATGAFIPERALTNDAYCRDCHAQAHAGWSESAHRRSSYSNPFYVAALQETMRVLQAREGHTRSARLCAACHDPVPLFSGALASKPYQDAEHAFAADRLADAGITCTVCHAITQVQGAYGNGAYTLDEPAAYPFTHSTHPLLRWFNRQLTFARPALHKETFLKPLHRTADFCGACHQFSVPAELSGGAPVPVFNQYDSFMGSGLAGRAPDGFYFPDTDHANCNACHMAALPTAGSGSVRNAEATQERNSDHRFATERGLAANAGGLAANAGGLADITSSAATSATSQPETGHRLKTCTTNGLESRATNIQPIASIDLFGIRLDDTLDSKLVAPLRPELPTLRPGGRYVLEVVLRNLGVGHALTGNVAGGGELWVELSVRSNEGVLAESGCTDARDGSLDPAAYLIQPWHVDANGRPIDHGNLADTVATLYDHSIPPQTASIVHYLLEVPSETASGLTIKASMKRRARSNAMLRAVQGKQFVRNDLPAETLATDELTLPIRVVAESVGPQVSPVPHWERWNDFGIACLRQPGGVELPAAEQAFQHVLKARADEGKLNLLRVYLQSGRIDEANAALAELRQNAGLPEWRLRYWSARVLHADGAFVPAIAEYRRLIDEFDREGNGERKSEGLDFARDPDLLRQAAQACWQLALELEKGSEGISSQSAAEPSRQYFATLREARALFERALVLQPYQGEAAHILAEIELRLGNRSAASEYTARAAKLRPNEAVIKQALQAAGSATPVAALAVDPTHLIELHPPHTD